MSKTKKTFHLTGSNVLLKWKEPEERSKGGILIPQKNARRPLQGTVLAIGPHVATKMNMEPVLSGLLLLG